MCPHISSSLDLPKDKLGLGMLFHKIHCWEHLEFCLSSSSYNWLMFQNKFYSRLWNCCNRSRCRRFDRYQWDICYNREGCKRLEGFQLSNDMSCKWWVHRYSYHMKNRMEGKFLRKRFGRYLRGSLFHKSYRLDWNTGQLYRWFLSSPLQNILEHSCILHGYKYRFDCTNFCRFFLNWHKNH